MNRLSSLPLERTLQIIGGRWKGHIVCHLKAGSLRLSELEREIEGISQKVLIQQLRDLEEHGVVCRNVRAQVPARVDYRLTPLGEDLLPLLGELHRWGLTHGRATGDRLTICGDT
ncbi:helix-turn-helix domain-containing protein [Devosia sp. XK-2]|uniref:winged helix-turn-helix transcriptional regulator n=1 Tax=Devosia sp. XK-2 TaxID=3126689 RepID=UPI0030CE9ABA